MVLLNGDKDLCGGMTHSLYDGMRELFVGRGDLGTSRDVDYGFLGRPTQNWGANIDHAAPSLHEHPDCMSTAQTRRWQYGTLDHPVFTRVRLRAWFPRIEAPNTTTK